MSACGILGVAAAALFNVCAFAAPVPRLEPVNPGIPVETSPRPLYERSATAPPHDRSGHHSDVPDRTPARTAPIPAVVWTGLAMIGGMIVAAAAKRRKQ